MDHGGARKLERRSQSRREFAADSPLEGNGFEISVPRQDRQHFDASVGLGPIDCRRGGIIRAVVGLGKPIDLFRRLDQPPLTAK
jgi:hypothetical protein